MSRLKNDGLNSNYLKERTINQFSNIVKQWKRKIASYNLKNDPVFDNSEKARYQVVFKNKQVDISVVYDNDGEILETKEMYKNIKIPYKLGARIAKEYPGWSFAKNMYYVTYSKNGSASKQNYKIQISSGKLKKTLRFNESFQSI